MIGEQDAAAGLRLVILAGNGGKAQGRLAQRFAVSHACLAPLAGRSLIGHVLHVAASHPRVVSLAVSIEREAFDAIYDELTHLPGRGTVQLVEARDNLADSVRDAMRGWNGPVIVTTADTPLLTAASIDAVAQALTTADAVAALVRRKAVDAVHPRAAGRGHILADGAFVPCNLYGLMGPAGLRAVDLFRHGPLGHNALARVRALGLLNLVLARAGLLDVQALTDRLAARLGARLRAVILNDGTQAIDVHDDRSYAIAGDCLAARSAAAVIATSIAIPPRRAVG
ncbi:NTP transferase domain-containing protein [Novosphingobium colocasiae]|uniref:NTP transferase domain-containing protein n=1 Tax=Novosphingobium colocasiae TaxID=1256513 RepID=UPI0035AF1136